MMFHKRDKRFFLAEIRLRTKNPLEQRVDLVQVSEKYAELGDIIYIYANKVGAELTGDIITDYCTGQASSDAKFNNRNCTVCIKRLRSVIEVL
jgi:hypothetical protein